MLDIQIQKRHTFKGHTSGIYCLQPIDDHHLLSAGGDGQVVKWNLKNPSDGQVIAKLDSTIYGLLADHDKVLIGENSRALHLLDYSNNTVLRSIEVKSPIFDIHRFGDLYLVGTGAGELLCFDLNLNLVNRVKLSMKSLRSISSHEDHIALAYSDDMLRVVNKELELIHELAGHSLSVFSTPSGMLLRITL